MVVIAVKLVWFVFLVAFKELSNITGFLGNCDNMGAYGVFILQLIRYARACSSYECFILGAAKLLGQGYFTERLKSSQKVLWWIWGSHQTLWSSPLPNVTWHSGTWSSTVTPLFGNLRIEIQTLVQHLAVVWEHNTLHQFLNLSPNWTLLSILTYLPNFGRFQ